MISAYGANAERYAHGLPGLDAVVTEPQHVVQAYFEALARRERGESFYGMILDEDPRVALAYGAAPSIVDQFADVDMRARAFAKLADGTVLVGGRTAAETWNELSPLRQVSAEFYRLASAMLVRSFTEFAKIAERMAGFPRPVERVLAEPPLPAFERVLPGHPCVVVWAPHRPAEQLALHAFGLGEFLGEVWFVAADGSSGPHGARTLLRDDPRTVEVLARSAAVVCVEPNDPGDAVAFARRGFGVVAPLTAGAHEFAPEVVVWDAADAATLPKAVVKALARPAAVRQAFPLPPAAPPAPPAPVPREQLPLVSVVIPTYNRPQDLARALAAVGAQTYPFVEAVVVNDAGAPVGDVVAAFPFARLIDHDVNRGAVAAIETGLRHARADYIEFLPDDD